MITFKKQSQHVIEPAWQGVEEQRKTEERDFWCLTRDRKSRSSVFLCSPTPRKHLLGRLHIILPVPDMSHVTLLQNKGTCIYKKYHHDCYSKLHYARLYETNLKRENGICKVRCALVCTNVGSLKQHFHCLFNIAIPSCMKIFLYPPGGLVNHLG